MKAFQKVAVATDFGASSRRAVDYAVGIAEKYGANLVIVHAVEPFIPPYPIALMPEPGTFKGVAEAELQKEAERVRLSYPRVTTDLLVGSAADRVTKFVSDQAIDLLVVGTHGRRGPSRWLLGSVAEELVRTSRVPVLTVRSEE